MDSIGRILLFGLWLSIALVTSFSEPIGSGSSFNDDFCDNLVTGEDETLSSACSGLVTVKLACKDQSHVVQRIYASRVGDGVCDCCDGSDESPGVCSNNSCEIVGLKLKESMREMAKSRVEGLKTKARLVQETKKRYEDTKAAVDNEIKEGPKLDAAIKNLEVRLAEISAAESVALSSAVKEAQGVFEQGIDALAANLQSSVIVKFIAALTIRSKEEATEAIGLSLPFGGTKADVAEAMIVAMEGPSTNDADISLVTGKDDEVVVKIDGVPVSGPSTLLLNRAKLSNTILDDMVVALALSEDTPLADLLHTLKVAVAEGQLQNVVLLSALDAGVFGEGASVSVAEAKAVIDALPPCKYIVQKAGHPSKVGDSLREELAQAKRDKEDLTKLSKDAGTIMAYKNADFGPDNMYYAFHGQCFRRKLNYMYSVCPFGEAHQGQVLLGRYQGIEMRPKRRGLTGGEGGSNGMLELSESSRVELGLPLSSGSSSGGSGEEQEMWMIFRGGNYCHPAQRGREMHLRLECHHQQEAELQDVTEPETCLYTGVIRTPLAC